MNARLIATKRFPSLEISKTCLTCRSLDTKPYIKSTSKGTYHNLKITNTISCKTRNVIYVITCTRCKVQYAGMTTQPLHNRFSNHLREMFTKRPANWVQTRLYRHVQQNHHIPSDVQVQPVECTEDRRKCLDQGLKNNRTLRTKYHPIASLHLLPLLLFCCPSRVRWSIPPLLFFVFFLFVFEVPLGLSHAVSLRPYIVYDSMLLPWQTRYH